MTKQVKEHLKTILYYTKLPSKRYNGVKGKAWGILSDYCRQRDYIIHRVCVSCLKPCSVWQNTDAGHYISMGGHGALIGFYSKNINMQCKFCNLNASQHTGAVYKETLIARYGKEIVEELEQIKVKSVKADDWFFIEIIKQTYEDYIYLKDISYPEEFPDYLK